MNLTTKQAAERLGISEQRVRALIKSGRLKAVKFGKAHMIPEWQAVKLVRKNGRPRIYPKPGLASAEPAG